MMPEALTTHSGVDSLSGCILPAAIASAFLRFSRRTNSLKHAHSSGFSRTVSGCHTPCPVIEVLVDVRTAMAAPYRGLPRRGNASQSHGRFVTSGVAGGESLRLFTDFRLDLGQRGAQER